MKTADLIKGGAMKKVFNHLVYYSLLIPLCFGATVSCHDHDSVFTKHGLLVAPADKLQKTVVSGHLRHPIRTGQNVLWCGTFQLAWNECCKLIGEDLHLEGEPPMAGELNRKAFTRGDLDEDSYVALAGFVRDRIHKKIRQALKKKFKGKARPRYIPSKSITPRPQDIVAYAYLFKNLEFAAPFEDLKTPIKFGQTSVKCFGVDEPKPGQDAIRSQVSIFDYISRDDFIIELHSKSESDRIVLAKVAPAATLEKTIAAVRKRIDAAVKAHGAGKAPAEKEPNAPGPLDMWPVDILKVPKFNFDITRRYKELEGRLLLVKNPKVAKDLFILSALQNIRFQMDERGVRLRSESHLAIGCGVSHTPEPKHIMIFDKPFLLMLRRTDAKVPYFALWVDNPELLVPTGRK